MPAWVEWSVSKTYLWVILIDSIDVYLPIIRFVLPARLDHWSESHESTFDSVLFWTARVPWLCASPSRQGKLQEEKSADSSRVQRNRSAGRYCS